MGHKLYMNKRAFFSQLYNRLIELEVSEDNINKYIKQFERYFNTMTDEEANEQIRSFDGVEGVAQNIINLIKKREEKERIENLSAENETPTRTMRIIDTKKTENQNGYYTNNFENNTSDADNKDQTKIIDKVKYEYQNSENPDKYESISSGKDEIIKSETDIDDNEYITDNILNNKNDITEPPEFAKESETKLKDDVEEDDLEFDTGEYEQILTKKRNPYVKEETEQNQKKNSFQPTQRLGAKISENLSINKLNSASVIPIKELIKSETPEEAEAIANKRNFTSEFKKQAKRTIERRKKRISESDEPSIDDVNESSIPSIALNELDDTYFDDTPIPNTVLFWSLFAISLPLTLPLFLALMGAFFALFAALTGAIIGIIITIVCIVLAGTGISLVGIIYGITQLFEVLPVGLFEIGFGIIIGGSSMLAGVLLYNFAIRLLPLAMKYLTVLFKFTLQKLHQLFRFLKRECAKR